MKYITKRNSITGKKFSELEEKIKSVQTEAHKEYELFNTKKGYSKRWALYGGIEAIVLPEKPISNALRLSKDYSSENTYVPNLKTKEGKELKNKWDKLPVVEKHEANEIVNFKERHFANIGLNFGNKEYVGFSLKEEWNVKVPEDCEEITTTKWNELFKS